MSDQLKIFEAKIEAYYLSCMPKIAQSEDKSFLLDWPLYKFSIARLHAAMEQIVAKEVFAQLGDKLIDIKLHYAYLLTVEDQFHRGATLIVGNNEIEKLNPNTLSALRGIHYRVYLLSVLFEQTLDLLHLALTGKESNFKKGKWKRIIDITRAATIEAIISSADATLIDTFKAKFRTAEMHKFSMVRALTSKESWNHLHEEELAAGRILANLYSHYLHEPR